MLAKPYVPCQASLLAAKSVCQMPKAIKATVWRISLVYIASLTLIGLLVPWNDPRLLGGSNDSNTSPFVIAYTKANVIPLADLTNAAIVVSVLSVGMSCVYAGSRTMMAMAEQGFLPKWVFREICADAYLMHCSRIFAYVDKAGRPLVSVVFIILWFPLGELEL